MTSPSADIQAAAFDLALLLVEPNARIALLIGAAPGVTEGALNVGDGGS
jgi:hypothetical protein